MPKYTRASDVIISWGPWPREIKQKEISTLIPLIIIPLEHIPNISSPPQTRTKNTKTMTVSMGRKTATFQLSPTLKAAWHLGKADYSLSKREVQEIEWTVDDPGLLEVVYADFHVRACLFWLNGTQIDIKDEGFWELISCGIGSLYAHIHYLPLVLTSARNDFLSTWPRW